MWQVHIYQKIYAENRRFCTDLLSAAGPTELFTSLNTELKKYSENQDAESSMHAFTLILLALEMCGGQQILNSGQIKELSNLAETMLRVNTIPLRGSRLSFCHGDLYHARAHSTRGAGDLFSSAWLVQMADFASGRSRSATEETQLLAMAEAALFLGHCQRAITYYEFAERTAEGQAARQKARLGQIRGNRLLGRIADAQHLLNFAVEGQTSDLGHEFLWEQCRLRAQETGTPEAMIAHLISSAPVSFECFLESELWAKASKSRTYEAQIRDIQVSRKVQLAGKPAVGTLLWASQAISFCYDQERPLHQRLEKTGRVVSQAASISNPEHRLLFLAAVARWLFRNSQNLFCDLVTTEYKNLSRVLSLGQSDDLLNVMQDIDDRLVHHLLNLPAQKQARTRITPPVQKNGYLELARATFGISRLMMQGSIKSLFHANEDKEAITLERNRSIAQLMAGFTADRRGALVKVGQIISYLLSDFDEEISKEFRILQADVTPIPSAMVEQVFTEDFGCTPQQIFKEWDPVPVGAGSIGQVHRAVHQNGTTLAVKVQYPDINRLIEVDLHRARMLKPFFKRKFSNLNYDEIYDEVVSHVSQEIDYRIERKNQDEFRNILAGIDGINVPKTYAELSSRRIMTSEFIEGVNLYDFVEIATQEERNKAGAALMQAVLLCNHRYHIFNADTQPANFIFHDGKVSLIDFGCVKRFPESFNKRRNQMLTAFTMGDYDKFMSYFSELGFLKNAKPEDLEQVVKLFAVMHEPFLKDEAYRFPPDLTLRTRQAVVNFTLKDRLSLPKDFVFTMRIIWGFDYIMSILAAEGNWRRMFIEVTSPITTQAEEPARRAGISK